MMRTARVSLLQLRAFAVEDAEASLRHTLARIDEAARQRPDVVVLPEMTYPAYFLGRGDLTGAGVRPPAEVAAVFAAKAREHRVQIAVGMALEAGGDGREAGHARRQAADDRQQRTDDREQTIDGRAQRPHYSNGALLFGRDGSITGRYEKSFLWHFDRRWFAAGNAYPGRAAWPVFETDAGRIGMLICADGRVPEIARALTVGGAQIILDLTAWVSGARHPEDLTSPQRTYLMRTRAAENGVWIAAADKVGVEAESIVYCGGSCVIDPGGRSVAQLGPAEEGILTYDVPVEDARPPVVRRPELYDALTWPTERLPVERTRGEAVVIGREECSIAVVQMRMPADGARFVEAARRHARRLALQDARLVLFPATPSRLRGAYPHEAVLDGMTRIASDTGVFVAFTVSEPDADGWRAMYLVGPGGVVAKHRQTHKPPGPRFETMPLGDEPCPVVESPAGRIGMMIAAEGAVPEVARSLMLRGAEIVLWAADDPALPMEIVARTRADENRVYVACSAAPTANAAAMIVEPSGAVLAQALEGRELAVSATVNRALAHLKERAPGTDVVRARQPAAYGALTRREPVGRTAGLGGRVV
ncbi:MAG: carbon-nitrogen hydrolase family protein [Chloroflexota bacterium]|nr:carbon-nitrogen hydrolase family protein [Chloroflexota bacterium]